MLTQGSDNSGVSHTSANNSPEKSRREDAERDDPRTDAEDAKVVVILISNPDGPDRKGVENGDGVGVVTSMSLQRTIYHCSYIERILNRLYRRTAKKDEDTQSSPL